MTGRKLSDVAQRPPEAFAAILAADPPLFLVGGQAVNLWALYYRERTADLAPFVSRDVDVLGDRETLIRIAEAANAKPQFFPMRPPTNEIGVVVATGPDGQPLPVEVLRGLHGIGNDLLCHPAYTIVLGERRVTVRVPGPIALFQAKIANVADLAQTGRQDTRHVRILAQLMPAYLTDLHASVAAGRVSERDMLNLVERLLAVVTTPKACQVLRGLAILHASLFAELDAAAPSRLHSFLSKRLSRAMNEPPSR
jgi:hypothetical protein